MSILARLSALVRAARDYRAVGATDEECIGSDLSIQRIDARAAFLQALAALDDIDIAGDRDPDDPDVTTTTYIGPCASCEEGRYHPGCDQDMAAACTCGPHPVEPRVLSPMQDDILAIERDHATTAARRAELQIMYDGRLESMRALDAEANYLTTKCDEWRKHCDVVRALGRDEAAAWIAEWLCREGYVALVSRIRDGNWRKR